MTSQANHVTQDVVRPKDQYLTLVKVSSNSIYWLMRNRVNKIGWKEKKKIIKKIINKEKKKNSKKHKR